MPVASFEEFHAALDHIARYTFLTSSFTEDQMSAIARSRMITEYEGTDDLIEKVDQVGFGSTRWRDMTRKSDPTFGI